MSRSGSSSQFAGVLPDHAYKPIPGFNLTPEHFREIPEEPAPVEEQPDQLGLFPEPERRFPSLAEMSPDQFANHPNTVFHSSYYKDPRSDTLVRDHIGFHAGTEQSALERARSIGEFKPSYWDQVTPLADTSSEPAVARARAQGRTSVSEPRIGLHKFNLERIDNLDSPISDGASNSRIRDFPHPTAYVNEIEDPDSLSVRLDDMSQARTHSEVVRQALESGLDESRLHPLTRHLYRSGNLDAPELLTRNRIKSLIQTPADIYDQHGGGLFPYRLHTDSGSNLLSREETSRLATLAAQDGSETSSKMLPLPAGADSKPKTAEQHTDDLYRNEYGGSALFSLAAAELNKDPRTQNAHIYTFGGSHAPMQMRVSERGDIRRGRQFLATNTDTHS